MAYFYQKALIFFIFTAFVGGEERKVKILHTTDLHCQIHNHQGGWLKLCGTVKKCRQQWGEDNCLLIDCGDTIQGSVAALATKGEVAIDFINHLKYDAWVLGNHELDFGIKRLKVLLDKTTVPILNGNFSLTGPGGRSFKAFKIYKKNGVKIAVIGMQASFLRHWFIGQDFENYEVSKVVAVLPEILKEVKSHQPHMTILALHHGFNFSASRGVNEIRDVTRLFPQIDLVLGGHTHRFYPGQNIYGTYYSQAGFHGSHLGVVEATIDTQRREVSKLSSWLVNVEKNSMRDEAAERVYEQWRPQIEAYANEVTVELPQPVLAKGYPGEGSQMAALIAASIQKVASADIALHGKFSEEDLKGQITRTDLFKVIPYENNVFTIKVNRAQLLKIMEEQVEFFHKHSFNAPHGFEIILDRQSKKLLELKITEKENFILAINSRVAAGGGGRFPYLRALIQDKRVVVKEFPINSRDAVEAYLKQGGNTEFLPTVILKD